MLKTTANGKQIHGNACYSIIIISIIPWIWHLLQNFRMVI